jgi:hypothetical protein
MWTVLPSRTTMGTVLPWWIFRTTFCIVFIAVSRHFILGNLRLELSKHKLIVFPDRTFVIFHCLMVGLSWISRKHTTYKYVCHDIGEYSFHDAEGHPVPSLWLSFRQFSFYPYTQFFISVHQYLWSSNTLYPPTCYTPLPVSLLDKSGDDSLRLYRIDIFNCYLLKVEFQ